MSTLAKKGPPHSFMKVKGVEPELHPPLPSLGFRVGDVRQSKIVEVSHSEFMIQTEFENFLQRTNGQRQDKNPFTSSKAYEGMELFPWEGQAHYQSPTHPP